MLDHEGGQRSALGHGKLVTDEQGEGTGVHKMCSSLSARGQPLQVSRSSSL